MRHLIRRGLNRTYNRKLDEIPGVRGKLELSESIKRLAFPSCRAVCEFDEYGYNTTHNQIIKATLGRLVRTAELDHDLREDLRVLYGYFESVDDLPLSNRAFRRVQLHSNNRFYLLLLQVCWILFRQLLPTPKGEKLRFVAFTDEQMETVFEQFVRN